MNYIGVSVSLRKKYEDEDSVIYCYGDLNNGQGEFEVNKTTMKVNQIKSTTSEIDKIMYLSSVAKIVKLLKSGMKLPEQTSYNS